eukprot:jgi/Picsp_1/2981/NSC_01205-R1_---NA---
MSLGQGRYHHNYCNMFHGIELKIIYYVSVSTIIQHLKSKRICLLVRCNHTYTPATIVQISNHSGTWQKISNMQRSTSKALCSLCLFPSFFFRNRFRILNTESRRSGMFFRFNFFLAKRHLDPKPLSPGLFPRILFRLERGHG